MQKWKRSAVLSIACAATSLVSVTTAHAQVRYGLQKINTVDLSPNFATGSAYGSSPLSIAFDGTNAYIGGRADSAATTTVGVVQVQNVLGGSPTLAPLTDSTVTAAAGRGYDSLAYNGDSLFIGFESGSASTSTIRRYVVGNSASTSNWTVTNPLNGLRVGFIAIDPVGDPANNNQPIVAAATFSGSGRRLGLSLANGALVYGPTGSATPPEGFAINTADTAYRAIAFSRTGDIVSADDDTVAVGRRVGFNSIQQLGSTSAGSSVVLRTTPVNNNVGRGVGFLEGAVTGGDPLIVASLRSATGASTPFLSGASAPVTSRQIQIRNRDGSTLSTSSPFVTSTLTGDEDGIGNAFTGDIKNFATGVLPDGTPVLLVVSYSEKRLDVYGIEPTWNDADGTWSTTTNWALGRVADGVTQNAKFGFSSAARAVNLDSNRTVKNVKFDSANSYTISGAGTLTLDAPGDAVLPAIVQVDNGSHTIASNIVLNDNARFIVNGAGNTLTLSGDISASGRGITKLGAGTLRVKNLRASAVVLSEGLTQIIPQAGNASVSRVATISQGTGTGRLDLTKGGLVIDYPATDPNPFAAAKAFAISNTDFIFSSTVTPGGNYAIGVLDGSVTDLSTLNLGVTTDATSIFMRVTLLGDANLDQTVNFDDLLKLAAAYNQTGQEWANGDFNYDGTVNFDDLLKLASNYNSSVTGSFAGDWALAQSAVPEPTSMLAIVGAGIGLTMRRRRR
jgi:hypothetical protein